MASVSPLPLWKNRRRVTESVGRANRESHASCGNSTSALPRAIARKSHNDAAEQAELIELVVLCLKSN